MKLESVAIENFRSIETAKLTNCDGFNVLIGKNNSGKSNILSAINAFFICIQNGSLFKLDPPIGQDTDFFKKTSKNNQQVRITHTFVLSPEEKESLERDIFKETKKILVGIDHLSRLSMTIKVEKSSIPFCFVSKLALVSEILKESVQDTKDLLIIGNEAAFEIRDKLVNKKNLPKKEADRIRKFIDDINEEDLRQIYQEEVLESGEGVILLKNKYVQIPDEILEQIRFHSLTASGFDDFKKKIYLYGDELKINPYAKLNNKITTLFGDDSSIPAYIFNLLSKMSKIRVLSLTEKRDPIGEIEAERILEMKLSRRGTIALREIQETVSYFLGVNIDAFKNDESSRKSGSKLELDVDDFLVQINGSGIREALRIILELEFKCPDIFLVEEPEVHLHPSLETSMMQYLKRKSADCQIFITTHSTNFLDTAEMKNIYLVSKPNSTRIELLNLVEAEEKIPKELGIRLSSLFMYDKLIFVEGPSDENVLREMALKLDLNLDQYNVGFILMGGVRNFAYYATEETLTFLTKRRVELWFLIDKDERELDHFQHLKTKLKGKATIKILNKRELENYLIQPRALREFIKQKHELSGISNELPDLSKIERDIDQCADKLKQFTINKRLFLYLFSPIHPSQCINFESADESSIKEDAQKDIESMINKLKEEKEKIEKIYTEQSEIVNNNWETKKLSMVPGDILINNVCQKYGTKFNKVKDGKRLARLLAEDEIDKEIKEVFQDIFGG